jgi:hypothetical protein
MSPDEAVARDLGLVPACELAYPKAWRDGDDIVALDGDLREYLLQDALCTRIIRHYRLNVQPGGAPGRWIVSSRNHDSMGGMLEARVLAVATREAMDQRHGEPT